MIFLLIALLQINLHESLDSFGIWNKTIQYIIEGKMKVPGSMNYFIFDESNITALDINGEKMNTLYQKQKEIFDDYSVPNYIFACDNLEETTELLVNTTHNLAFLLRMVYGVKTDNAIILLISMKTRKMKIRTGDSIKRIITDGNSNYILSILKPILGEEKYYEAWDNYLYYIGYYNDLYYNNLNKDTVKETDKSTPIIIRRSSEGTEIMNIIGPIIGSLILTGIIVGIIIYCYRKQIAKKKFNEISNFLRPNRNNVEVFKEYCVLCLKPLYNSQIQLTTQVELNNGQQQPQNNANNISSFICEHKFHHKCLQEFKIVECPICSKKKGPLFPGENAFIIWDIQQNMYPMLKKYNYNQLFSIKKVNKIVDTNSVGGASYGGYTNPGGGSIGGGSNGGNSIGGGSVGGGSIGGASYGSGGGQGSF